MSLPGFTESDFIEEDAADDKPVFAAALRRHREARLDRFSREADLVWYSLQNGPEGPITGAQLEAGDLERLAQALGTLKTADFSAGIPFDRGDPRLQSPADLAPLLLDAMSRLAPLYEAALPADDLMT